VVVTDEEEWEVDDILDSRLFERGKQLQYKVKWTGLDQDLEWYNANGGNSTIVKVWWKISTDAAQPSSKGLKSTNLIASMEIPVIRWQKTATLGAVFCTLSTTLHLARQF
jgi:hypothetical protein